MTKCRRCNRDKPIKGRWCSSCKVWRSRQNTKNKAIEYKGGCCQKCGYKKCTRALEFHHLDPEQKDFGIASSTNRSWERVKKELDKCVMLCANCHAEEHERLENAFQANLVEAPD